MPCRDGQDPGKTIASQWIDPIGCIPGQADGNRECVRWRPTGPGERVRLALYGGRQWLQEGETVLGRRWGNENEERETYYETG